MTAAVADLGAGHWTASLLDRATGQELELEPLGWTASLTRAVSAVSDASVTLDPEYAARLARRPVLWANELVFRRDGRLQWVGPVTAVDDSNTDGVTWSAQDRMAVVMSRRWFWRNVRYAGDAARLFELALRAADYGDAVGLTLDPRPNGVVTSMTAIAGDKVGAAISDLTASIEWTVIGDVLRFGEINASAEQVLPADAWGGERPSLSADGYEPLSHVCTVTDAGLRMFYPSADPNDRLPGSPLLVDTVDVGNVSLSSAAAIARRLWFARQGEFAVISEGTRDLDSSFPLRWPELIPGAVLYGSVSGRALFIEDAPIRVESLVVEVADSKEVAVRAGLAEVAGFDPLSYSARLLSNRGGGGFAARFARSVFGGPAAVGGGEWVDDGGFANEPDPLDDGGSPYDPFTPDDPWVYDSDDAFVPGDPFNPSDGYPDGGWGDFTGGGDYDAGGNFSPGGGFDEFGGWAPGDGFDFGDVDLGGSGPSPGFDPFEPNLGGGSFDGFDGMPGGVDVDPYANCPDAACCGLCGDLGGDGDTGGSAGFSLGASLAFSCPVLGATVQFSAGGAPNYGPDVPSVGSVIVHDMVLLMNWDGTTTGSQPLSQLFIGFGEASGDVEVCDLYSDPYYVGTLGPWFLTGAGGDRPIGTPPNLSGYGLGRLRVTANRGNGRLLLETAPAGSDAFQTWHSEQGGGLGSFSANVYFYYDMGNNGSFPAGNDQLSIAAHAVYIDGTLVGYADGSTFGIHVGTSLAPTGAQYDLSGPEHSYQVASYPSGGASIVVVA